MGNKMNNKRRNQRIKARYKRNRSKCIELKTYTNERISKTKNEIGIQMIARITKVVNLQEDKVSEVIKREMQGEIAKIK